MATAPFGQRSRLGRPGTRVLAALAVAVVAATLGAAPSAHAAEPRPVTHPEADHAGSGLVRSGVAAGASPALSNTGTQTLGMDVSGYQGNVDWASAWGNGARFAFVKATEGTSYVNPYFAQQYNGSRSVGMIRGAYHFALPDRASGAAQADYLVNHGGGWSADGTTLPPVLDIEYNPYGPTCYGLSQSGMVAWISSFGEEVRGRTGRYPVIYSTTDWWSYCTGNSASLAGKNPLWLARYSSSPGQLPAGYSSWSFWQYSSAGRFPGDQDVFNGGTDSLRQFASIAFPPTSTRPAVAAAVTSEGSNGAAYVYRADTGTWASYGGRITGAPAVATARSPYKLYLVASTPNGLLYARTATTNWTVAAPTNSFCAEPDLTYAGTRLLVACTGSNKALYTARFDTTKPGNPYFGTFTGLGGSLTAGPAVYPSMTTATPTYVAVGGTHDATLADLYTRTDSTWWTALNARCASHPAAGSRAGSLTYTGCRDSLDGTLHVTISAPDQSSALFDGSLGGRLIGGVGVAVAADDSAATFFVEGTNGQVYRKTVSSDRTATGWISLGGKVLGGVRATPLS